MVQPDGELLFEVDEHSPLVPWQFSRLALEDLFFPEWLNPEILGLQPHSTLRSTSVSLSCPSSAW